MATAYVHVKSEKTATHTIDWARRHNLEAYVVPALGDTTERTPPDHVTINDIDSVQVSELMGYFRATGRKVEVEVEDD
jgi:hypothetical protein